MSPSDGEVSIANKVPDRPPYFRFAFANPYNLSLLLGSLTVAGMSANWIVALVALGAEGLWLLHAPDSRLLRRLVWDPQFQKLCETIRAKQRERLLQNLPASGRARVQRMIDRQQTITRLASQNPTFTGDLLRGELGKTATLVQSFVEVALTCNRYERYLGTVDINALERERERWHVRADNDRITGPEREIAKKNYAVILKRLDKLKELRNYLSVAWAQLDLMENSFQLIADQIMTMQSPTELSGQLDELLDGVESVRQTAADTERLMAVVEA